jgi:hypothetical protein
MSAATEVCTLDQGALVIDLSPLAPPLRIQPWNADLEVARHDRGEWRTLERTADLQIALDVEEPVWTPIGRFVCSIPPWARIHARRCGEHAVAALRLLRLHPRARVMARTPNLLWLVARFADERGLAVAVAALDGTPSEVLAECLGAPIADGAVGLLARVLPEERQLAGEALFAALRSPRVVRALRHQPDVVSEFLWAACKHEEHCTQRFFRSFLRYRWDPCEADRRVDLFLRTIALGHRLGIPNPEKQLHRGCTGVPFDRWRERALCAEGALDPEVHRYPSPAIAGTDTIVAIRNSAELCREGRERRNCLLTYDDACLEGAFSAYRVLAPERATLVVNRHPLEIEDLRGWRNVEVSRATRDGVEDWIIAANAEADRG